MAVRQFRANLTGMKPPSCLAVCGTIEVVPSREKMLPPPRRLANFKIFAAKFAEHLCVLCGKNLLRVATIEFSL
jgi:hypothetical protein